MKPTAPENTISPSSTSAVMVGSTWAICASGSVVRARCPATYAMTVARMKTTPPIVGVPFLPSLLASPRFDRIGWPALSRANTLIAIGVPNSEIRNATPTATMTALMPRRPPWPSPGRPRAARRPPPRSGTGSP